MGLFSTERIARACARRPWLVVAVWIAIVAGAGYLATGIGDVLTTEFAFTIETDSTRADSLLEERLRGPRQAGEQVLLTSSDGSVDDPAFRAAAEQLIADLRALDGTVSAVVSYFETGDPSLVSADRRTLRVPVRLAGDAGEASTTVKPLLRVVEEADGRGGLEVMTTGDGSIAHAFTEGASRDAEAGERIGVPVALAILLLVFGAAVAAVIPLVMALGAIVTAFGAAAVIGRAYELSFQITNIVPMIGLAVGIDYSLLIVQRFREERAHGAAREDAIGMAAATASRTVVFSGGTVVVGLLGMTIVPTMVYRSLAIGAISVTVVAVLAALTLLPAILSLLGDRVNWLRLPFVQGIVRRDGDERAGFWGRVAGIVMGNPWPSVVLSAGLLVALTLPALSLNLGLAGVTTLPEDDPTRVAFERLAENFSAGQGAPVEIVVAAPDVSAAAVQQGAARLEAALASDTTTAFGRPVREVADSGDLLLISVPMDNDPDSEAAHAAVRRLRSETIPAAFEGVEADVLVTGMTAGNEDFYDVIRTFAPYVFAFVLGLSFLFLLVVFRSIVVPIKALVMNLLSVGAAYGMLTLVFQKGFGTELLGFRRTENIEAWLPLFLFSILFGLSMDYHVFLLSRIRERFLETRDNAGSVAFGLRTTAGMITGAALIMVAVFTGFALGDSVPLQQVGFGLAVAVILDATIIRSVLVPASMELLGEWNWYLPSWLRWLPRLDVEKPAAPRPEDDPYARLARVH